MRKNIILICFVVTILFKKLLISHIFLTAATTTVMAKSIYDYDLIDNGGNGVNNEITSFPSHDYQDVDYETNANNNLRLNEAVKRDPEKYELVYANDNRKRNILSALRAKIRRSDLTEVEEKHKFAPVLSVGKLRI